VKRTTRKRILLALAGAVLIAAAAGGIFVLYLDRIVTPQFEGRRWTLPAQVYAQPLELYAGSPLTADDLQAELKRLHYEPVQRLVRPGTYRRIGNRIDIASRRVELWDEVREPQGIRVSAGARGIDGVWNARGEPIAVIRLDPLLIGSIFPIHGEDRIVVTPQQVPALLPAALKVVEDRKFDTHHGVDPQAIARAAWVNLRAGRIEQGGSTLTQQLVRSYFLDQRQTFSRKFREAVMAMILEARFGKADLLNAYINEIYLGQDGRRAVHGFGLAARFYFGKPLEELDLAQIALLVAVVRGPSYYDPRRHPARALARRDLVLRLLAEHGVADKAAIDRAMERPLGVVGRVAGSDTAAGGYFPAYLEFVRRTLKRDYREEDLTEAGLKIFTALDPRAQAQAEAALNEQLARLEKARARTRRRGDGGDAPLEGAVVVTAPQSGEVIALVGGRRIGFDGFNRALDARRPIGSLVKPAVYLAALETGRYHPASIVQDEPLSLRLPTGQTWAPENYTREYAGPVPLVRGLAESLNLATVHLGLDVGLPAVARTLERLGAPAPVEQLPAVLLGAVGMTPLEVAQMYGSLASGGFRTPLRAVRAVVSAEGKPLKSFPLEVSQVADAGAVYQLNRMMMQVVERGTGRAVKSRLPGTALAGKTGTSSDLRDSWFGGFSGSHLAVVWVGHDDNSSTGLTGASGALPAWAQLMAGLDATAFEPALPDSLEELLIDFPTGLGATPDCIADKVYVPAPRGTEVAMKPGCGRPLQDFTDRARDWLRGIIR
jgi:penicillin-binding protein 1B